MRQTLWHVVVRVPDGSLEDVTISAVEATGAALEAEELVSRRHESRDCWAMLVHPTSWRGLVPDGVRVPAFSCEICEALRAVARGGVPAGEATSTAKGREVGA